MDIRKNDRILFGPRPQLLWKTYQTSKPPGNSNELRSWIRTHILCSVTFCLYDYILIVQFLFKKAKFKKNCVKSLKLAKPF